MKSYDDSLTIREHLAKQEPDNAEWQQQLAETYNNLADICGQSGDTDSEVKWSIECHQTLQQMRKLEMPLDPKTAKMLEELDSRFGQ